MAENKNNKICLVCFSSREEIKKFDTEKYGIETFLIIKDDSILDTIGRISGAWTKVYPWHKRGGVSSYTTYLLLKTLNKVKKIFMPHVIELDWTDMVYHVGDIQKVFPDAEIIGVEHDITFQSTYRKYKNELNPILRPYRWMRFHNVKTCEMKAISRLDIVYTLNIKDDKILEDHGVDKGKRRIMIPYYHRSFLERKPSKKDIIYFGYMRRKENEDAVVWFIKNVMPLLDDLPVRFVVVGGGPSDKLKSYASNKVIIKGYVPEVDSYFACGLCTVVPLRYGAGIKIKTIEAMYSGIPVLANTLGIEGINAKNGRDYLHCETACDFEAAIRSIYEGKIDENGLHGKETVEKQFNIENSFASYYSTLKDLSKI